MAENPITAAIELAADVRWLELAQDAEFTLIDRQMLGDLYRRGQAASAHEAMPFTPTHYHALRGNKYQVVGVAQVQAKSTLCEGDVVTVYQGADGQLWVRPCHEFNDGRFVALHEAD